MNASRKGLLAVVGLWGAAGGGCSNKVELPPVVIDSIEPARAEEGSVVEVTVRGRFHLELSSTLENNAVEVVPVIAQLGELALDNLAFVDETTFTGSIPAGLSMGTYELRVELGPERTAVLADAFEVFRICSNNGDCQPTDPCIRSRCVDDLCVLEPNDDQDADGFIAATCGGDDCDDEDPNVFPGTTCDDDDACTQAEICNAGICEGVSSCPGVCDPSCADGCGGAGDCCFEECTGDCDTCLSGCSCTQICESEDTCRTRCEPGSTCFMDAVADDSATLDCDGAICTLECTSVDDDCRLNCMNGGTCLLTCGPADECILSCPSGATSCGGGTSVCNRQCP